MKLWNIWSEGYATNGMSSGAIPVATGIAGESFHEAVAAYVATLAASDAMFYQDHGTAWTMWSCRLFDNESEARKRFG